MPPPTRRALAREEYRRQFAERAEKALNELERHGLLLRSGGYRRPLLYAFRLNDRQCLVLNALDVGVRDEEVAARLGISVAAVRKCCTGLRSILGGGRFGIDVLRDVSWLWRTGQLEIVKPIPQKSFKIGEASRPLDNTTAHVAPIQECR